jgi:hypothetical protein
MSHDHWHGGNRSRLLATTKPMPSPTERILSVIAPKLEADAGLRVDLRSGIDTSDQVRCSGPAASFSAALLAARQGDGAHSREQIAAPIKGTN